jgi:flagellar motor switch/type III secretory pathway protein FliN
MDVPCPVDFVLGTATLTVADCARLAVDDVVRLAQPAGTDLELRVAGVPICTGEVLVVDQKVSLRLARVLPPVDQDVL